MTEAQENTQGETTEKPKADIVRGRMPVAMVYAIRFLESGTDGELAAKYATTNGKISDIKKGRNFGYVTEDTKFSKEEIDKAIERAAKLGEYEDDVVALLNDMDVGSEEDAAKLDEQRKASRKPRGKAAEAVESDDTEESDDEETEEEVDIDDLID